MPIREYIASGKTHCALCGPGFERLQKLREAPLAHCPECGAPVTRKLSAVHAARGNKALLSESNLDKHGFTQYKRIGKGQYEKTAGRGPAHISDK